MSQLGDPDPFVGLVPVRRALRTLNAWNA